METELITLEDLMFLMDAWYEDLVEAGVLEPENDEV
jgi:hypothetical protein